MMEKRIADILQKMSLKEKITLCNKVCWLFRLPSPSVC